MMMMMMRKMMMMMMFFLTYIMIVHFWGVLSAAGRFSSFSFWADRLWSCFHCVEDQESANTVSTSHNGRVCLTQHMLEVYHADEMEKVFGLWFVLQWKNLFRLKIFWSCYVKINCQVSKTRLFPIYSQMDFEANHRNIVFTSINAPIWQSIAKDTAIICR